MTVVVALAVCSCTTSYLRVEVDAINDGAKHAGKRYVLKSGMKDVPEDDLYFKSHAKQVRAALRELGFVEADAADADVAVSMVYGNGDPQTRTTVLTLPIYRLTGGGSAAFSATAWGSGGFTQISGILPKQPSLEVVGQQTVASTRTTYSNHLILYAVDLHDYRKTGRVRRIWQAMAATRSKDTDLRASVPILVAGIKDYVAANTERRITVEVARVGEGAYAKRVTSSCGEGISEAECQRAREKCGPPAPSVSWERHIGYCKKEGKL